MNWLPSIFKRKTDLETVKKTELALEEQKTKALSVQAEALKDIAHFLTSGGLSSIAQGVALSNTAASLLNGLTVHDGRQGLDARTLDQNALEIATLALKVKDQFQEKLSALAKGPVDNELHDGEADYKKWAESK